MAESNPKAQASKPQASKAAIAKSTDESAIKGDVQKKMDEIQEQGYLGTSTDPTPDENYTVSGVAAGKPTPETDDKQRAEVRKAQA